MPKEKDNLEPVTDLKMVERYLQYGMEFRETVSCYIEEAELKFETTIKSVDAKKLFLEMEFTEESFAQLGTAGLEAIDRPQGPVRFSYSVNEASFFVQTKFQFRQANRIVLKAEMPMFKLQRRESLRIKVLESHKAALKLAGKTVTPLFDISAGGLSFVVNLMDQKDYKKGQMFPNATLTFLGKEIKVNLEVKNILAHSKDGLKWKIGLRFRELPASVEQVIAREAYLHSHKIWSRLL
jgi:c-di-GMP-binding flagellar brake protein YcgR